MKTVLEGLRKKRPPEPIDISGAEYVPVLLGLKAALHNYLCEHNLSYAIVCRMTGMTPTQVNRIASFLHESRPNEVRGLLQVNIVRPIAVSN